MGADDDGDGAGREIIEGSFHVEQEVPIAAPRGKVWKALVERPDAWWSHRFFKQGSRVVIEPRLGGRFYETIGGPEEGVLWGTVMRFQPGEVIAFNGPLGMDLPVNSVYSWRLEDRAGETILKLTHRCTGLIRRSWAEAHDGGWGELWGHLKRFAETGEPLPPRG